MKRIFLTILLAGGAGTGHAQTRVDLRTQGKSIDFSDAVSTRPAKTGTTLPATCSPGELFFKTNAPEGNNLFGCTGAAQWKQMASITAMVSGCGLIGCEEGACGIDSSIIPNYMGELAAGRLLAGGGGSIVRALEAGSAGQVLTSNGPGLDPAWTWVTAAAAAGGAPALDYTPLDRALNLSDVGDAGQARTNLGLGAAAVRNVGSAAGTVAAGDDARFTDARDPLAHKARHAAGGMDALSPADIGAEAPGNKGQPGGYAPLDGNGRMPAAHMPARVAPMYQQYVAAKCQSGVAFSGFSLPGANAPAAACVESGTTVGGVLVFANGANNQSLQDHFQLPPDWSGEIDLEVAGRSGDAAHQTVLTIQTACVSTGSIENPVFSAGRSLSITGNASKGRTAATASNVASTGCGAGNEYYFKITADTTALDAPHTFDLIALRWTIRRTF